MVHISKNSDFLKSRLILWPIGAIIMLCLLLLGFYYLACLFDPDPQNVDNSDHAYELGLKYKFPDDVTQDFQKSAAYFDRAIQLGNNEAKAHIIHLYALDELDLPIPKIFEYVNDTNKNGLTHFSLGIIYLDKEKPLYDKDMAETHYLKAFDLGFGHAANLLHLFYSFDKRDQKNRIIWQQKYDEFLATKNPDYPFVPEHIIRWYLNKALVLH